MSGVLQVGSDWPFIAHFAAQSEAARKGMSRYVVVVPPGTEPRHTGHLPSLLVLQRTFEGLRRLRHEMNGAEGVLVHGMEPFVAAAVATCSSRATVMWSGWGYDYYGNDARARFSLYEPLTRAHAGPAVRGGSLRSPRRLVTSPAERLVRSAAARRSQYFSAPIPQDLDVFRASFPKFRGDYLQINYGTLEDQYATEPELGPRENILLGNSADPTNNHLDVLEVLARSGRAKAKVIVPLTYGPRQYAEHVATRGARMLGDAFIPIMEHMSLRDYNRLVSTCGAIVMPHHRQQALGNIITAITSGAAVFMSPRSPAFTFLVEQGVDVRDWRTLDLDEAQWSRSGDSERLGEMWGRARVLERTAVALDILSRRVG